MIYGMFGDFHGSKLDGLREALIQLGVDVGINLGDYDQPLTVHDIIEKIEPLFQGDGKLYYKVPGNHDHAILNDIVISSQAIENQGMNIYTLIYVLNQDEVALAHIKQLLNTKDEFTNSRIELFLDEKIFEERYKMSIGHGALAGNDSVMHKMGLEKYDAELMKCLWTRLTSKKNDPRRKYNILDNFRAMQEDGIKIVVMGHDHEAFYAAYDPENEVIVDKQRPSGKVGSYPVIELSKNKIHLIKIGAFCDGWLAIIDTNYQNKEVPVLQYIKMEKPVIYTKIID